MITDKEGLKGFISSIDSPNKVYELFKELNYPKDKILDISKRDIKDFDFAKDEREKVKNIYPVFSYAKDLNIFFIEVKILSNQFIRYITRVFDDRYNLFLLILTIDFKDIVFVFPERGKVEVGKHKLKITKLNLKRDELYYTDIETILNITLSGEESTFREIWFKWKEAFNVEKVTTRFFEDYKEAFFAIRKSLNRQKIEMQKAHEYTIQFLNRIMFIYFISKKRWLNDDPRFMKWYWGRYRQELSRGNAKDNTFYQNWLKTIFFEAFNNQFSDKKELPDDVNKTLMKAPFLNGGLFRWNPYFDDLPIDIDDKLFSQVFEFFENYNFTIKEDMPLDMEVAVDPQMIGYVYESLANVAEKAYESDEDLRGDWGIFYTPRVEVDFMARRAIVEYLAKKLPKIPKEKIYELVFDEKGTERFKENVETYFEKERFWSDLEEALDNLSAVDPACGSGAFMVGMLNVLVELYKIIYKHHKRNLTDFRIKKRIIGKSLYGVDVMPWAIHAAELRLWLQLIVESDLTIKDLKQNPLLPNLSLNLRIGDSLVQEIGGINLHLRDSNVSDKNKKRLDALKQEKEKFFNNDTTAKFNTKEELVAEEARIFEEIIRDRIALLEQDITQTKKKLKDLSKHIPMDLSGMIIKEPQEKLIYKEDEYRAKLEKLESDLLKLKDVLPLISDPEKKPFVWDIDFAEIFGDKGGFDVVIGNPPYVSYQKISPPNTPIGEIENQDKRDYIEKLKLSVHSHFSTVSNISGRSDYYIYFYFNGLSILNPTGTFCFITSNSWLDVEFGRDLKEFLLKFVPIIAIYDNPKKAFEHADVNTIISLFGSPNINEKNFGTLKVESDLNAPMMTNIAKFVMFKKPFEEVINAKNLMDIDQTKNIKSNNDFRVYPISQKELLDEGWEYPEGYGSEKERNFKRGKYIGSMWGSRYLKAPDIFIKIKEKGKLIRLDKMITVETYLNTLGSDDFFFVQLTEKGKTTSIIKSRIDDQKFEIENEFLSDFVESPKELESIQISGKFNTKLFRIPEDIKNISKTKAYSYIQFGKRHGFKTELPKQAYDGKKALIACYMGASHIIYYNPAQIISHRFFRLNPKNKDINLKKLVILLNSTLTSLSLELFRNPSLGGGVLAHGTFTIREFLIPDPAVINLNEKQFDDLLIRKILPVFEELGIDPSRPIHDQEPNPKPDRKKLDDIIFDAIGLTKDERKEVYWAVCELVKDRLNKASSLKKVPR